MSPFVILASSLALASPGRTANAFVWDRWGIADGLPQHTATQITQGPDSRLIFGTFAGVVWFDGVEFVVGDAVRWPTMNDVRVTSVLAGEDGLVWVGLQHEGVAAFDGDRALAIPRLDSGIVWSLAAWDDRIWAGTSRGLWVLDPLGWSPVGGSSQVRSVAVHDGRLFVGGDLGLFTVDPDGLITWVSSAPLGGVDLWSDGDRLWGAWARGFGVLDDADQWIAVDRPVGAGVVAVDLDGGVWEGRAESLIRRPRGATLAALRAGDPLPADRTWDLQSGVRDLYVSRDGAVWVGTDHGGLARVTHHPFEHYGVEDGLPHRGAGSVHSHGGEILVTQGCDPLTRIDPDGSTIGTAAVELANSRRVFCPRSLETASNGDLWIGHDDAVSRVGAGPPRTWEVGAMVLSVHETRDGTLWIGTIDGAFTLDGDGPPEVVPLLRGRSVGQIVSGDVGDLWFALDRGIAIRRRGGQWQSLGTADGLPGGVVRSILPRDGGETWIGTYGGGLARIRADGRIDRFSEREGLRDNVISRILEADGALFLNGNRGLSRVGLDDLDAVAEGQIEQAHVTLLQTGEGNGGSSPAGSMGAGGRLWFPTISGVVSVDPADLPQPEGLDGARILGIDVGGTPHAVGPVRIASGRREVTVRFGSSALERPDLVRYATQLSPIEPSFSSAGARRYAHYDDLDPGNYTFEVMAVGADGAWSAPTAISITVERYWTEEPWFKTAIVLLGILAVGGGVGWRMAGIRRQNLLLSVEIASREETEGALRVSEAHYRGLFEASTDGILVVLQRRGQIIDANPAAARLFRADPGELRGIALVDLVSFDPPHITCFDGTVTPVRLGRGSFGEGLEIVSISDLSQIMELQERLEDAQHLEVLGRLAGGLGHGYNNLLTALQIRAVELGSLVHGSQATEALQEILTCADQGAELTRQLLAVGRKQDLRPVVVDVVALVRDLEPYLQRMLRHEVSLVMSLPAPPLTVLVDPGQFERAVLSLAVNAIEVMPKRGICRISVTLGQADTVVVTVQDTGPGIEAAVLPHIFEPFYGTHGTAGTGLGLASVLGFAKQSGGDVRVQTEIGVGTRFDLILPRVEGQPAGPDPVVRPLDGGLERILLIDDDHLVRRAVQRILESAGYEVLATDSGMAGLDLLGAGPVGLMITDVKMPRMDGIELAELARGLQPDLDVIFMSGYTEDMLSDEVEEFISKPFMPDQLLRVVRRILDR